MFWYITVFGEKITNYQIFKNALHTIVARKDSQTEIHSYARRDVMFISVD